MAVYVSQEVQVRKKNVRYESSAALDQISYSRCGLSVLEIFKIHLNIPVDGLI